MVFYFIIGIGPPDFSAIRYNVLNPTFGLLFYPCESIPQIQDLLGGGACQIPYWILAPLVFSLVGLLCVGIAATMQKRSDRVIPRSSI